MHTRRTLLRSGGLAALTAAAGCVGLAETGTDDAPPTTTTTNGTTNSSTTTATTASQPDDRFHLGKTSVLDDFEDLSAWSVDHGSMAADTSTAFAGSQSMRLTAPSDAEFVWATREVDWDLSEKTLSLAVDVDAPVDNVIVSVRLLAPDAENSRTLGELVRVRPNQGWMRLDLGTRTFAGTPDLSSVAEVQLGMRAASDAIDMRVDDLRSAPRPDAGAVVFSFDDSLRSHYTEAFQIMQEYGIPGNVGVITGDVGSEGSLTVDQMSEMQDAGWQFVSHGTSDAALTDFSTQKTWRELADASDWLAQHGLAEDGDAFVYPHGVYDDAIVDYVGDHHDSAYRYMDPLSASSGFVTDPMTIGRGNAAYNQDLNERMVTYAEQFNNLTIFTFHGIDDSGGLDLSPERFRALVDYVDRHDVEVLTFSDVQANYLAD